MIAQGGYHSQLSPWDSIQRVLRGGRAYLAVQLALSRGVRDENKLTDFVFYARHPERKGRQLKRSERQLVREWLAIRNDFIRPILGQMMRPRRAPSAFPAPVEMRQAGIDQQVLARIAQYDILIDRVGAEEGIEPNWIRGVIAAESGGKRDSGKGTGGYKGLMQARKDLDQLRPEISIRTGAQKLKTFRGIVSRDLRRLGIDPRSLGSETMIRLIMVAYNAGPATLRKAMQYAIAAGERDKWREARHFQRALIYYGAYSVPAALRSCLEGAEGNTIAAELGRLSGIRADDLRNRYLVKGRWNRKGLWQAIKGHVARVKERWKRQAGLTLEHARERAPRWLLCAVAFKHRNVMTWYVDRILAYRRHYTRVRSSR